MNRNEDRGMILGDWPGNAAAVDAEWLDTALRRSGVLSTATVRSVSAANLGLGVGIMGEVSRLSIAYDKPEPGAPEKPQPPEPKPTEVERTRWQRDDVIRAMKTLYPPDGIRPRGVSIAAVTKRIKTLPEFKEKQVSEDTVRLADLEIKVARKK